jgi:hypothetical protein
MPSGAFTIAGVTVPADTRYERSKAIGAGSRLYVRAEALRFESKVRAFSVQRPDLDHIDVLRPSRWSRSGYMVLTLTDGSEVPLRALQIQRVSDLLTVDNWPIHARSL